LAAKNKYNNKLLKFPINTPLKWHGNWKPTEYIKHCNSHFEIPDQHSMAAWRGTKKRVLKTYFE
jgi:hypothetical protein